MQKNKMKLGLFDPGMTNLHRVGLAGLYMTLNELEKEAFADVGSWELERRHVTLEWKSTPEALLRRIAKRAFGLDNGVIRFAAHNKGTWGDLEKLLVHEAILYTYLQHGRTRKTDKNEHTAIFDFEKGQVTKKYKFLHEYSHKNVNNWKLFKSDGTFGEKLKVAGWLMPGGTVRHVEYKQTSLESSPAQLLCLLFAPIGSIFFLIVNRTPDGKFDSKIRAAIVLPEIKDLEGYFRAYTRYLSTPARRLYASSLGDAGLSALITLNTASDSGVMAELDVKGCKAVTMGTVGWASQQKTRTGIVDVHELDVNRLNQYAIAIETFPNIAKKTKDDHMFFTTSLCRGLIGDNLAVGKPWFLGFVTLMRTSDLAKLVSCERRELAEMVEKANWTYDADMLLVSAVHKALRKRYGMLAATARQRGEAVRFDREFERIRTSLMRVKNGQTLRAELADLFARGGVNPVLQEHWSELLPLFTGPEWQRARDLTLLALASYTGAGVNEIESAETETSEKIEEA